MSIVSILVVLIVLALAIYIVQLLVPIDATLKKIIIAVICLLALIWILNGVGYVNLGYIGRPL